MDDVATVTRFLRQCDGDVRFCDFGSSSETVVTARMCSRRGLPLRISYMDKSARDVCCELAESFRDLLERNIFFDLINGRLHVFLEPIK